jgi:drug/metabolite transporter (DMT)-like permease
MKLIDLNKSLWQWIFLIFLAIIWGSSFILMKKGLEVYSHSVVASLRISIAFLVLLPFTFSSFKQIELKYWKYLIFTGICGNGIPAFLFTLAQTEVSSSLSGMLNSLTPIFALIIGILMFNSKPKKAKSLGVFIGLIGAIGLILSKGISLENSKIFYSLLIVIATICYALSVNVIKAHLKEIDSILITSLSFLSIGPFTIAYLFYTDFIQVSIANPLSYNALIYIVILSVFGTALAIIMFNMLIKTTSTLFATSVTYLIPIVAIIWGLMDGEKINIIQVIIVILALIGVYTINKFK